MQSLPDIAFAVLARGLVLAAAFASNGKGRRRSSYYRRHDGPGLVYHRPVDRAPGSVPDAADQLRAVDKAKFHKKPLLRFEEGKVFAAAEAAVREAGVPWRVFAQVSLGEVLGCEDREGFNAINAKRVDLLIVDGGYAPIAAIEYQGSGHHLSNTAAARDAVKKEALRKAEIGYIEITQHDGPADVRREISRLAFARARTGTLGAMRRAAGG
jgi:hypothetical protein